MYQSQRREFQFPESLKESLVKEFDYYGLPACTFGRDSGFVGY